MVIRRVTNFPLYIYIEIEGKKPEEFIRVNKEDHTFSYKDKTYEMNQLVKDFTNELEAMDEGFFDWAMKELPSIDTLTL